MMLWRICGESRGRATLKAVAVIVVSNVLLFAAPGIALATT